MQSSKLRVTYSVVYDDYTRHTECRDLSKQEYNSLQDELRQSVSNKLIRWYSIDKVTLLHRVHVLLVWHDDEETTYDWYMSFKEYREYVDNLRRGLNDGELKDYMVYLTDKACKE